MMSLRVLACAAFLFGMAFLSSCGYGFLGTCRTPCDNPNQERDSFCACNDKDKTAPPLGHTPVNPTQPYTGPQLHPEWEQDPKCGLDSHLWIYNYSNRGATVTVSYLPQNGQEHKPLETIYIPPLTTTDQPKYDLGLQQDPALDCWDKEFSLHIDSSSPALVHGADAKASALAEASSRKSKPSPQLVNRAAVARALVEAENMPKVGSQAAADPSNAKATVVISHDAQATITTHAVEPIDCVTVCGSGTSILCSLRGFPPNQDKLKSVRDSLLGSSGGKATMSTAAIYNLFGVPPDSCPRDPILQHGQKLVNSGQFCALPMQLSASEKVPSMALQLPETVIGQLEQVNSTNGALTFPTGSNNPSLIFRDPDMNANFGGSLLEVRATSDGLYYETTAGCVFMEVSK